MNLWAHQKKAVELARVRENLALFFEIGTGKTATMITILREDFACCGSIVPTLIFAPLSVCAQWKKEFGRFSKVADSVLVLTGDGAKRTKKLEEVMRLRKPMIVVTNYEGTRIKKFYAALLKWCPELVVIDESHRLKDASSKTAAAIYPLCLGARRRFLLTGTPVLNSLLDLFGQFKALDPQIFGGNAWKFKNLYFYDKNAGMPSHAHFPDWQPRPESAKAISEKIAANCVQAKKSECLDLPPLLKVPVTVPLSDSQRVLYDEMERDFVTSLGETQSVAEFAMTKTLRLQQILAGFLASDAESAPTWVDEVPRLNVLKDLLESIHGQKTIIWTVFRPTYKKLAEVCEKAGYKVEFLTGDQSDKEKQEALQRFCEGDSNALIANPSAGGTGVNIYQAPFAVYYSRGHSLAHYLQSEGRNYRGGSECHERVVHYELVSEGTLDEVIAEALKNKQDVGTAVQAWIKRIRTQEVSALSS